MPVKNILIAAVAAAAMTGGAVADEPDAAFRLGSFHLAWLGPDGRTFDGISLDRQIAVVREPLAVSGSGS